MRILGKVLRWLLVPVTAVAVVAAVVAAGRWGVALADRRCPVESMVGGACVEPWHTSIVEAAIYIGAVAAAAGLVVLPAMVAPHFKRAVGAFGLAALLGGSGYAYSVTGWVQLLWPCVVALPAGALALWWVWSRTRQSAC